jgi:NAD(P)-dependent dehydrogenase (short-subunit alcohol dehydrogenase family)
MPAGSAVITTASIQAYQPSPILLDYATTKGGIVAYTKALAKQLIERGIRANVVAPRPVWTVLQPSGGQPDGKVKNFGKDTDFGRPGQPVELARVFVLLASSEASFINGEVYALPVAKASLERRSKRKACRLARRLDRWWRQLSSLCPESPSDLQRVRRVRYSGDCS